MSSLDSKLEALVQGRTPSMQLEFYSGAKLLYQWQYGENYRYYDLSSLTKMFFTTTAFLDLVDRRQLTLTDPVQKYLPWFPDSKIQIGHLLTHSSGLPWWLPAYETLKDINDLKDKKEYLRSTIQQTDIDQSPKSVYSDVGFWTLGFILESIYNNDLMQIWSLIKDKYYPNSSLHFNPIGTQILEQEKYAPTELCPWRKIRLQGLVHDDNAYSLGGVATHSGLFGSIKDVSTSGLSLLQSLKGQSSPFAKNSTQIFTQRENAHSLGDWGYGFMLPGMNNATCGEYFSKSSFGHLGFTGVSLWMDPVNDWVMSILTNRVYFGRDGDFPKYRGKIHDLVVNEIVGDKNA